MSVPVLQTPHPNWAQRKSNALRLRFPGAAWRGRQGALTGAILAAALVGAPGLAGLATFGVSSLAAILHWGPTLTLDEDSLLLEVGGTSLQVLRSEVRGARVERAGRSWRLLIAAGDRVHTLEDTGATGTELRWAADAVTAWAQRKPAAAPEPPTVLDEGVGVSTWSASAPLDPRDFLAGAWLLALIVAMPRLVVAFGVTDWLAPLLVAPFGALLGHLAVSRRAGRVEIELRDQSLSVHATTPREETRTVALADVAAVTSHPKRVSLTVQRGPGATSTVDVPAKHHSVAIAAAIEARRSALAEDIPRTEVDRAGREALAKLAARAGETRQ